MNLIVFNMSNYSDWEEGIVNRNYFVTQELVKREEFDKILFVDFLAQQPFKKLFGRKRGVKYALKKRGLKKISDKVFVYQGLNLFKSKASILDQTKILLKTLEMPLEETVLWSYNAFFPELFTLNAKVKVFDAVDNWSHHASYKQEAAQLKKNYVEINKKADTIFTVSEGLKDLFDTKKVSWVPNGIDLEKFQAIKPVDFKTDKKVIGYVGTIQERLDFDLIEYLLKEHPEKKFVFIGPVWKGVQDRVDALTHSYENVEFLGRIAYEDVPHYLASMDVTIIPHRIDEFINSTNPMKMYDYLAVGKPIVTTPGAGTDMFSELLEIHEDQKAFSDAITRAIETDSLTLEQKRKEAVSEHSWKQRVQIMMQTLLN